MYEHGRYVVQEDQQAAHWYHEAAKQGHAAAQYNIGVRYEKGCGIEQDYQKAAQWYRKVAEQKSVKAQFCLKMLALQGKLANL